jgi:GGDEF domain-containing protein
MFVSIKRYLDSRPEQVAAALLGMVRQVLKGLELHAVRGEAADYEKYRADLRRIQEEMGEQPSASEVQVAAGAAVEAMEEYHNRTSRFIRVQCAELQTMVGMLTKTMTTLASGSENSVTRLQTIEKQLHKASLIEDFQAARQRLAECLDNLRGEVVRQKEESQRTVAKIRTELKSSQERTSSSAIAAGEGRRDPATRLPGRQEAEAALIKLAKEGRHAHAAIFVVERLELINARFGFAAGDQVLSFLSEHLTQSLSSADRLFRWSGPALLALLERDGTPREVREEVARITAQRLEKTVNLSGRSVLLPVGANSAVFPVADYRPVQLLFLQFDNFVQGGGGRRTAESA